MANNLILAAVCTLVLSLLLSSCSSVPAEKRCSSDQECVKDACCHASGAVNLEHAPDCKGLYCTAVCEPGTLDCGQGEVKCIQNQCQAVFY